MFKQTMVCLSPPWNITQNIKEWTVHTYDNLNRSQVNNVMRKKANPKGLHTIWIYLYNILEIQYHSNGEEISSWRIKEEVEVKTKWLWL